MLGITYLPTKILAEGKKSQDKNCLAKMQKTDKIKYNGRQIIFI